MADISNKDIERLYIEEELDQHGEYLTDLFVDAIERHKLIEEGDLLESFQSGMPFRVYQKGNQHVLEFKFPDHGRFIEIQSYKKRIGTEKPDTNKLIWGITKRKKRSKNAKWYTRNLYGAQNRLIGRLMYGLGDIERERLINILKEQKSNG